MSKSKGEKVKLAHAYHVSVCECGCGSVNLVLEDRRGNAIAAAQFHPMTILDNWAKIAADALKSNPNREQWDKPVEH